MNKINRTLFVLLSISLALPAYSQDKNSTQKVEKKEEVRPYGLKKISTNHHDGISTSILMKRLWKQILKRQ